MSPHRIRFLCRWRKLYFRAYNRAGDRATKKTELQARTLNALIPLEKAAATKPEAKHTRLPKAKGSKEDGVRVLHFFEHLVGGKTEQRIFTEQRDVAPGPNFSGPLAVSNHLEEVNT